MKTLFAATLLLPLLALAARAETAPDTYGIAEGTVSYEIIHKLHKVKGTSRKIEGKGRILADGTAQIMVRVPVETFDSGNGNRDAHMKETVEAARFAFVELKGAADGLRLPQSYPSTVDKSFRGELNFHGVKKAVEVPTRLTFESPGRVRATTRFPVSLDSHKIERPSLMFVKVDDQAQIEADLVLEK